MTTSARPPTRPARPRRSRLRTVLPLVVAGWLVLEIWLLIVIADAAGGGAVLALLLAGIVGGSVVIRRTGRRAVQRLTRTLQAQRDGAPAPKEEKGGGLLIVAGLLMILPGPVSDVLGLLLLPPWVRGAVGRQVERRVRAAAEGWVDPLVQARTRRPDERVVRGEVIRDDEPGRDGGPGSGEAGGDGPGHRDTRPPLEP